MEEKEKNIGEKYLDTVIKKIEDNPVESGRQSIVLATLNDLRRLWFLTDNNCNDLQHTLDIMKTHLLNPSYSNEEKKAFDCVKEELERLIKSVENLYANKDGNKNGE